MKKIFLLIIISVFLFGFGLTINAETSCDEEVECGGTPVCNKTSVQTKCIGVDCLGGGCDPWGWPHCDCKSIEKGGSECSCECNEQCAFDYCLKENIERGYKEGDELYRKSGRCNPDKSKGVQCCTEKEYSCGDEIDNDCDDKIDCADTDCPDKTVCGDNKECKDKKCVEKVSVKVCPSDLDCQQLTSSCLCGTKETEVASGEFCCTALSKRYELLKDCTEECKANCPTGCENKVGEDCLCGSKLLKKDQGYCLNKKIYTNQDTCKAVAELPPGEKPPSTWIFTCKGKGITCPPGTAVCIDNPLCAESFEQLINAIINFIFYFSLAVAPIMFIFAGILFVTAAGVPEKIQKAKNVVLWTGAGLAIIIMAKGIITAIQGIF